MAADRSELRVRSDSLVVGRIEQVDDRKTVLKMIPRNGFTIDFAADTVDIAGCNIRSTAAADCSHVGTKHWMVDLVWLAANYLDSRRTAHSTASLKSDIAIVVPFARFGKHYHSPANWSIKALASAMRRVCL